MSPVSAEQFISQACSVEEIPGFKPGTTIQVMLKPVSLTTLAASGKIPNPLMAKVMELFNESGKQGSTENVLTKEMDSLGKIMDVMCGACMLQPAYNEVKDYMTDEQKMAIFGWSQTGVMDLGPTDSES